MGEELLDGPSPTCTEIFEEAFPQYLAIGMSPELFWDGDPNMARFYREADLIRIKRFDTEAWLQGMYIYEVLCDVAPIYHTFAKKGTKPTPYTDAPYMAKKHEREKNKPDGFEIVEAWATRWNAKWEREQELSDGVQ